MNTQVSHYYDQYLTRLVRDRIYPNPRHDWIFEATRRWIKPGGQVLDVGCGIGITTEAIARRGCRVVGVDISPNLIAYARATCRGSVSFLVQNASELDLGQRFDAVTLFDCIEHIPADRHGAVIDGIARHLLPGGLVLLTFPSAEYNDWLRAHEPEKLQIVDESIRPEDLMALMSERGLTLLHYSLRGMEMPGQYALVVAGLGHKDRQDLPRAPRVLERLRPGRILRRLGRWRRKRRYLCVPGFDIDCAQR